MSQFYKKLADPCAPQSKAPEKVYTRDEILLQREAYRAALAFSGFTDQYCKERAEIKYPLPKKIVPREVAVNGYTMLYRIVDGKVEYKPSGGSVWTLTRFTVEDFKRFGDLAANPTCEVEA